MTRGISLGLTKAICMSSTVDLSTLSHKARKFLNKTWAGYYPSIDFPEQPTVDQVKELINRIDRVHEDHFPEKKEHLIEKLRRLSEREADAGNESSLPQAPVSAEAPKVKKETPKVAQTAPQPKAEPKPAKEKEVKAKPETAASTKIREGKAPGGLNWVDWFKQEHAKGRDPKDLQDEYIAIRTPEYAERLDVLKRHAYRHRKLALPGVK